MSGSIGYALPPQIAALPDFWNLIFISGEITEDTAQEISHKLLSIEMINKHEGTLTPVSMFINSPGGDMAAAWQMCDIMDFIETPVHTIGLGQVCSAGLIVLMNGKYGERKVTDRTCIMSHQYSWGAVGNHQHLIDKGQEFNNTYNRMIKHYQECTGLDVNTIETELLKGSDTWLTAKQAKKFNLIDVIAVSNKTKNIRNAKEKVAPKRKK